MVCPKCNIVCRVGKTYYKTVDDDTAEKPTKVYVCHEMICRNRACSEYNTVVDVIENQVSTGTESTEN